MKMHLKNLRKSITRFIDNKFCLYFVFGFDLLFVFINILKQNVIVGLLFFAINAFYILFTTKKKSFYIIFLLYPLARVLKLPNVATSLFTILLLFFLIILLLKTLLSKRKIPASSIIVSVLYIVYCLFTFIVSLINKNNEFAINSLLSYYLYLAFPIVSFVCIYSNEQINGVNNIIICIGSYLFGILMTLLFYKFIPNGQDMLKHLGVNVFDMGAGGIRFSPLTDDPNYGTALILLLSCTFIITKKTKKQMIFGYILMIAALGLSALSLSKMFILGIIIIILCFVIKCMTLTKNLLINSLIILTTAMVLLLFIGSDIGSNLIIRTIGTRDGMDISRITSGRSDIFGEYSSYILQNPMVVIFGKGPLFSDLKYFSNGEHNTFTKNVFGSGIIGVTLMLSAFIIMAKNRLHHVTKIPQNIMMAAFLICLFICCMSLGLAPSTIFPIFVVSVQFIIFESCKKSTYFERIDI